MIKDILIFLGPQGSGKSTQAKIIANKKKYLYIEQSSLLKEFSQQKSKEAKLVKEIIKKGEMVSFEMSCEILFERIKKVKDKKIIIDGFPRLIEQAHVLDYFIYNQKHNLQGIVYINLSKKECIKRLLLRKRSDDKIDIINTRLNIYFQKTKFVIKHYNQKNKLIEINGNNTIEKVSQEIFKKIEKL